MNSIRENIKVSEEKMTYLFFNSFREKYELLTLGIFPNYDNNTDVFDAYEIQIELSIKKEIDPDYDYIFANVKRTLNEISKFCKEYTINIEGKMELKLPYNFGTPVLFGIDYLFADKFEIKTLIRVEID
jgi:hypothetical protein